MTMVRKFYLQTYRHHLNSQDTNWIDIDTLDIHPNFLECLAELGIIEIKNRKLEEKSLSRIEKILRLRQSLGVNMPGACIIIDLLERIEELEEELEKSKRR